MDAAYAAYDQKVTELSAKYGAANLVTTPAVTPATVSASGYSYLTGACVVDLLDFNRDGNPDLFVVYSTGQNMGRTMDGVSIPRAGAYEIEVWSYQDGELSQLLHETRVSAFPLFDADNCFVTVLENSAGLPVIQLYGESGGGCSYTNIYSSGGSVARDQLAYDKNDGSFTMNDMVVTEAQWDKNVSNYDKILCCVSLSSELYSASDLAAYCGINYNDTLSQTRQVVTALANGQDASFRIAEGSYIPLYLRELDQSNRDRLALDKGENTNEMPYQYGLYDADNDGTPELIVKTGTCEADYSFQMYTVSGGKLVGLGGFCGGESSVYVNGVSGLICYFGHMGYYDVSLATLDGLTLNTRDIASGETNNAYPDLSTWGYGDFNRYLGLYDGTMPYLLYAYQGDK